MISKTIGSLSNLTKTNLRVIRTKQLYFNEIKIEFMRIYFNN